MAEENIDVRVRLRGARKAAADAHSVARGIDDIGDEAQQADRKVGGFARVSQGFSAAVVNMGVAAGNASGALDGAVGGLGNIGKSASTLSPIITGVGAILAGALAAGAVAVGASALYAAAGLAAMGVAAGGVLVVGMGLAAVAAMRFAQQSKIAGTAAYQLNRAAGRTGDTLIKAFGPGIDAIFRGLTDALRTVRPLIQSLARPVAMIGRAVGQGIGVFTQGLVELGPEIRQFLGGLGPLIRAAATAAAPLLGVFLDIANAALPHLLVLVKQVAGWIRNLRGITSSPQFAGFVRTLVVHFRAWLALTVQVSRAFLGLLRAAAPFGLQLVRWLTQVARKMADWMNSREGQRQMKQFFRDVLPLVKEILTFVGRLVLIFARVIQVAAPGLRIIFRILNGVARAVQWVLDKTVALWHKGYPVYGGLAVAVRSIGQAWDAVKGAFGGFYNFIQPKIQWLIDKINWLLDKIPGVPGLPGTGKAGDFTTGSGVGSSVGKGFAAGAGAVTGAGSFLLGEQGPELGTLAGGRLSVQPLGPSQRIDHAGRAALAGDIVVPVTVLVPDGQVLGTTVARAKRKAENAK